MRRVFIAVLLAAAALVAVLPLEATVSEVRLAVPDRSNQTPSAAALGAFVAVAWGAQPPDGKVDVFVALSRDSGRTFDPPVRVNDIAGEARLGGELPPRVALVPGSGGTVPEIVVAYGSKATGTAIKVSRSTDGGRTFSPAREMQAPGAAGDRGWHARRSMARAQPTSCGSITGGWPATRLRAVNIMKPPRWTEPRWRSAPVCTTA